MAEETPPDAVKKPAKSDASAKDSSKKDSDAAQAAHDRRLDTFIFSWTLIAGAFGGVASYLLTQDPDFGDYWSWWVSTFFGLLGGVIGVYIIFGTDAARSNPFRAIVLGAVFGLSWPAVFKIGASMALTRNQEHTDTTEVSSQADDELKGALNTYKSELGDLTKPLTNGTTNSDDPTQGISVREQKVEQMMMIIPLLPDRETKRSAELAVAQAMEIVFESANAALADKKNFFREIQEVASQENCYRLKEYALADYNSATQSPANVALEKAQDAPSNSTAPPPKAGTTEGWLRYCNNKGTPGNHQWDLATALLSPVNRRDHTLQTFAPGNSLKPLAFVAATDTYLRGGPPVVVSGGIVFAAAVNIVPDGTPVTVVDAGDYTGKDVEQVWVKVQVATSALLPP